MLKQGRFILLLFILMAILSGCVGAIWSGANMVYDRHDTYKKLNDYQLIVSINNALYPDKLFKNEQCVLDLAVFNGDVLIAGHLPSQEFLDKMKQRLSSVKGYRHLYSEVSINQIGSNNIQDGWITAKIRSQIFADDSIDPNAFKIVTTDRIVYIMGDVKVEQAEKVVKMARYTSGVERVVKLMNYYTWVTKRH